MYREIATVDCRHAGRLTVSLNGSSVVLHLTSGAGAGGSLTTVMMPPGTARALIGALIAGAEAAEAYAVEAAEAYAAAVARKYAAAEPTRPALGVA